MTSKPKRKSILVSTTFLVVFLCLSSSKQILAQFDFVNVNYLSPSIDTVYFEDRSGGRGLDSLDRAYYQSFPSIFNHGRGVLPNFKSLDRAGDYRFYFSDERVTHKAKYHFTGLPYMGFFYSFGSGGEQVLDVRYTQNVGQRFNLSFQYHRNVSDQSNGAFLLRRSEILTNDLSLRLHYRRAKYQTYFDAFYAFDNYHENFGLAPGQINLNIENNFLTINNNVASARIRRAQMSWRNEYQLLGDSTQSLKFVSTPSFHIFQRRYRDSLNGQDTFSNWFMDSVRTYDSWEEPHLLFENGIQFQAKHLQAYGAFVLDYFRFYNFGKRAERLDGYIKGALKLEYNQVKLGANLRYFIFGTPNEMQLTAFAQGLIKSNFTWDVKSNFDRLYPEFFQLFYSANQWMYDNSNALIEPTQRWFVEGGISLKKKQKIRAALSFLNVSNLYFFNGSNWNFTATQQVVAPNVSWDLEWRKLHWRGEGHYFAGAKNILGTPDFLINTRLFFDGAFFKAQKLKVAAGIDMQFFDGLHAFTYQPELGLFSPTSNLAANAPQMFLNVFMNLQMDRFRLFVNVNRINTLFETNRKELVEGYMVRPMFMRVGVVFDFVN